MNGSVAMCSRSDPRIDMEIRNAEMRVATMEHQHRTCRRCAFEWLEAPYVSPVLEKKPTKRKRVMVDEEPLDADTSEW
jgi:hypothetical protein